MAAPSVSGGVTIIESCDTGSSGKTPLSPLASSVVGTPSTLNNLFGQGLNGTGLGRMSHNAVSTTVLGGIYLLASPVDLTVANRFLIIHHNTDAQVGNISTTAGVGVVLNSGGLGTEEAIFMTSGKERPNPSLEGSIVNANRSTNAHTYTGSFDPSDVTHVGIVSTYTQSFRATVVDSIGYFEPLLAINGTSGDKGDIALLNSAITSADALLNESPTENMHHLLYPWGVGDGSTLTHFSETLKVFESVRDFDTATTWGRAHINDNDFGYEANASSSDVIDFTLCNWISDTPFYWNSIGSTSATVSYTSCVIQNAGELTIVNGHVFDGCTFDACGEIAATAPTFTNTALNNAAGVAVSVGAAGAANMTGVLFTGNQTAIKVDVVGSTTLDATELTFDSSNTYYIEYTGTGTLTVTSPLSIAAGKLNASGGGTISVVSPTADLTVDSSETGSQIHVYTTTTQTILDSEASAAQLVYTHADETVDITVLKDGFIPYRQTGLVLSGNISVDVQLVASREYDSSHGLTYTTDASWASNQLTVPTFGVTGKAVFSLIMESFKSETALRNTAFNIEMDGANSLYLVNDAEGASDASVENLIECGCEYLDTAGLKTATWAGVKSVGTATGFTGEYQQIDGTTTTDARATGVFNELIKVYGDATHGNFDYTGHLVLKYQPNTYRESRSDVLADFGISALAPTLYILAMEPVAIGITAGDPAISITITDHTGAPLVVGGKSFDYEIVDNGANDGEAILRELNYNLSLDATYNGKDPFNWHEMVLLSGSTYESVYGAIEGLSGLHGVYVSRSSADHPDFTRHQSNDGTYYVKPITANASISTIVSGSRLRIYNETTATETYNDVPGTSFSDSYTEGTTYTSGDVISIYITQISTVTAQAEYSTSAIASSTGWSVIAAQVSDDVYDTNGIDGSTLTSRFTADYVNDEIDFATATNFTGPEIYAFYMYSLTTASGIENFFGGFTALDAGNYRNNNSVVGMKLDNTTTTEVWQTDTSRIFRADETRPIRNPTSGGGGIDVNWQNVVYVVTAGSGLTAGQAAELTSASAAADVKTTTDQLIFTKANELDINVQSVNGTTISGAGTELDPWGP